MKIVNIILCVLILLLGAASAVFSYFLFEKRSQFVTGWAKMADTMNKTAAELDKSSGTKIAAKLTPQALAHENYSNIDALLPELPKLGAQVITERDALAEALARISRTTGQGETVDIAKLQDLNTYSTKKDNVVRGVITVVNNRDKSYRNITDAFRSQLSLNIDRKKLLDGDASAFSEFKSALSKRNSRQNVYESRFREIAGLVRSSRPDFSEGKYDASLKKIIADIRTYRDKSNSTARELDRAKSEIDRQRNTIARMQNTQKKLNTTVSDRNLQIASFQRALGIPDAAESPKPWKPGSEEARAKLTGKVTMLNSNYGYLAVNIGKYSIVQQHIGNRTLEINPKVEPGLELIVTRPNGKRKDFVSRIKVSQVGETLSIANIPQDAGEIRVGDDISVAPAEVAKPAKPAKAGKAVKKTAKK